MDFYIEMLDRDGKKIGYVQSEHDAFKTNSRTVAQRTAEEMASRPTNKGVEYKVVP